MSKSERHSPGNTTNSCKHRLANLSPNEIVIEKGVPIAKAEVIDEKSVVETVDDSDIRTPPDSSRGFTDSHTPTSPMSGTEARTPRDVLTADSPHLYANENTGHSFKTDEVDIGTQLSDSEREVLMDLIKEFSDIMSQHDTDTGETQLMKHRIETGDAAPVHQRPFRISFAERQAVKDLVGTFLDAGYIRESTSPWACPIVLVRKKDGTLRFCCDWRRLNKVTKRDAMPLPLINDMIDRLGKAKLFTKLDFTSGFYQIPLDAESIEKSAFVTPDGHYEWLVMGMGLTNAPATFQRLMHKMLGSLLWTSSMAYMDDLIIHSDSFETHLSDLREVFERIRAAKLKIKPPKCSFAKTGIHYLGHVITPEGVRCDPSTVKKVMDFTRPTSKKEVRSFLGLTSYYRRFIHRYAFIAKPLHDLTRDDVKFCWSPDCDSAFRNLKRH